MLPTMFGGLGLPNCILLTFSTNILFLQRHWGFDGAPSYMSSFAYKCFLIKVGLYGNVVALPYSKFGFLVTKHTWFRNL